MLINVLLKIMKEFHEGSQGLRIHVDRIHTTRLDDMTVAYNEQLHIQKFTCQGEAAQWAIHAGIKFAATIQDGRCAIEQMRVETQRRQKLGTFPNNNEQKR